MSVELETLRKALDCYREGRYSEAERLYGNVLAEDPENADAWHLLGLLHLDRCQPQAAAGLISKAIQLRPDVSMFYNTLGNAFRFLGKFEQSLLCFERAIGLEPDYAQAFANLGSAMEEAGHAEEAIAFHRRAVELEPACAEVYGNLGNALRSAGRCGEAREAYEAALRLRPDFAEGWMNLGNLFFDREEYGEAERHYREALRLNPRLAHARTNLGAVLNQRGQYKEAEACCRAALEALPGDPLVLCNLAAVLVTTGRAEQAEPLCRRALEIRPGLAEAHTNLGLALARLHRMDEAEQRCRESLRLRPRVSAYVNLAGVLTRGGRFAEAEECLRQAVQPGSIHWRVADGYGDLHAAQRDFAGALRWYEQALELAPETAVRRPARAMVWLAMGDFARGWEEYELRWNLGDCQPVELQQPLWSGTGFAGQTLLLHAEQGLGDTLQFVRFVPLAKRLGRRVILAAQPELLPILAGMEGVDCLISTAGDLPEFDCHLPLLSLPRVLGTQEHTIPRDVPYLKVPAEAAARARERLGRRCGAMRVGLAWAGSPKHADDRNRSMRLEQLDPLLRVPGVQFFSLQQGATLPAGCPLVRAILDSDSLDTTAAIVAELDLIIGVDTMMVHLAGALGRPVWTLLQFAAEWRWMHGREDSPWYPTMRLFRQPRFGEWDEVVRTVAAELSRLAAEPMVLR